MGYNINGIGSMFYGKAEFQNDGSYITTQWFTVAWIPIIPIRSLRVKYIGKDESGISTYSSSLYQTQPVKLYKKHIITGYSISFSIFLFIAFIIFISKMLK